MTRTRTTARTTTSLARAVAVAAGLLLILTGCSGGGLTLGSSNRGDAATSSESAPLATGASDATSAADPTPSSTPSTDSSTPPSPEASVAAPVPNAAGVVDGVAFTTWLMAAARRAGGAHLVMSTKGAQGATSAVGDVVLSPTGIEEDVAMTVGPQRMHMRLLSDGLYLSMSSLTLPTGKKWVLISATGTDQVSVALRPMFQSLQANTMSAVSTEGMKGVAVKRVGAVTFAGVPVVRYSYSNTEAQLAAALKQVPAAQLTTTRAALAGLKSSVTMLVDAAGLTRQVVTTTTLKGKKTVSTVTYSGWGRAISITAPPASEVADASALA